MEGEIRTIGSIRMLTTLDLEMSNLVGSQEGEQEEWQVHSSGTPFFVSHDVDVFQDPGLMYDTSVYKFRSTLKHVSGSLKKGRWEMVEFCERIADLSSLAEKLPGHKATTTVTFLHCEETDPTSF